MDFAYRKTENHHKYGKTIHKIHRAVIELVLPHHPLSNWNSRLHINEKVCNYRYIIENIFDNKCGR